MVASKTPVQLTANFERNLDEIEVFLLEADAPQALDALLDELVQTVIPNLESFPAMGRLFLERPVHSIEARDGVMRLTKQLKALAKDAQLREYVMAHHLVLYACIKGVVYLLSIRHQKQLSFDFEGLWLEQSNRTFLFFT